MRIIIDNNEYSDVLFRETYDNVPFDIAKAINTLLQEYAHINSEIEYRSEELMTAHRR